MGLGIAEEIGNLSRIDVEVAEAMEKIYPGLSSAMDINLVALGINYRPGSVGDDLGLGDKTLI